MRVLVTRPAAQAQDLSARLQQSGHEVLCLPLQQIEPAPDADQLQRQLQWACAADFWVFTSANAVKHAHQLLPHGWPKRLYALGQASQAAAAALGYAVIAEVGDTSERLLARPEWQCMDRQHGVIIGGVGGRDMLQTVLRARGANIHKIAVYQRVNLQWPAAHLGQTLASAQAIIFSNGEAVSLLHAATPAAWQAHLQALPLVLPSVRVLEHARTLGFVGRAAVAAAVCDADFVTALTQLAPYG